MRQLVLRLIVCRDRLMNSKSFLGSLGDDIHSGPVLTVHLHMLPWYCIGVASPAPGYLIIAPAPHAHLYVVAVLNKLSSQLGISKMVCFNADTCSAPGIL